jgi:hypothetical protein
MENKLTLQLLNLNCYVSDESDADEVFLKYDHKKIWPVKHHYESMNKGSLPVSVDIGDLAPDSKIEIELWDYDLLSANDLLGTFRLVADKPGGPFNTDLMPNKKNSSNARYNLEWQILREG